LFEILLVMKYDDYLLKVLKDECPFCDIKKEYILEKWKHFTVILARAPYTKDHLLIVPNRHLVRLREIKPEEWWTLIPLIEKRTKKLEKIHSEVNLLLRDWVANWVLGKSVDHLHFHLIPDIPIYSATWWWNRRVYSDFQTVKKTAELKEKLKWK
jgi:diadenosine tetraphosphate (Ap4A) HIT family hydrolase